MKSICETCKGPTKQTVLFEKEVSEEEQETGWWETSIYQIIQCDGCESISYRTLFDSAYLRSYEGNSIESLFPKRTVNSLSIKSFLNTPKNIVSIYRETIDAYNNDMEILCSAGLRTIIEGICTDKNIKNGEITEVGGKKKTSKGLDGKIEGLAANGFLTKVHSDVLHELRFLGNKALHNLSPPSKKELKLAIDIVEHSIENIYELQDRARKLKAAAAKRNKQNKG